jgi:hypothetical protein
VSILDRRVQAENIVAYESLDLVVSPAGADHIATRGARDGVIGRGADYGCVAMVRMMVPRMARNCVRSCSPLHYLFLQQLTPEMEHPVRASPFMVLL